MKACRNCQHCMLDSNNDPVCYKYGSKIMNYYIGKEMTVGMPVQAARQSLSLCGPEARGFEFVRGD